MAADVTATVAAQLEQVRPILGEIFETSDQISAYFKKNAKEITNLNRYLYRIPLLKYRGGTFGKYNANGGSLPAGTGMNLTSLQAGFFYGIMMYRVTDEQVDESQNTKSSIIDVMAETLAHGMAEAAVIDDQCLHGDGTGELTAACDTITGTNTMTFNAVVSGVTDPLGASRVRAGMAVDVWTFDGATKRAAGTGAPIIVDSVDYTTNTVVFNQNVTSLSAGNGSTTGDLIAFYNMDTYGPSTLVSFTSGWPATSAQTNSGGLTNDSWRHGIYYAHDFNDANYYLGKLKSSLPEIKPNKIDATGQNLAFAHGWALQDRVRKRRSNDEAKNLAWIFPLCQRASLWDLGTAISTKPLQGEQFGKSLDLSPSNNAYEDTFNFVNNTGMVSKRQLNNRIDAVNFKNWGRAEVIPLRPYEKQGVTVFPGRASTGLLATYSEFGFQSAYDFVCFDPGCEGAVINLNVPPNY